MNEQQWLASTDLAAMFRLVRECGLATEGKCRVFVEACRGASRDGHNWEEGSWQTLAEIWCRDLGFSVPNHVRAALLRDIFGNPWRPWFRNRKEVDPKFATDELKPPNIINPDWLTPNVVALAQAAVTRECERCKGNGYVSGAEVSPIGEWDKDYLWPCQNCERTGIASVVGPLDPFKLAVLADALEESGCGDEGILGHLRTTQAGRCEYCNGQKHVSYFKGPGATNPNWKDCPECDGTGVRPVPHVWHDGGCWVIDLL